MNTFTARKVLRGVAIGVVPCLPLLAIRLWHWILLGSIADRSEEIAYAELSATILDPAAWIESFGLVTGWLLLGYLFFRLRWPTADGDYEQWLRTVPWSASKPLPVGALTPSPTAWIAVATTIAVATPLCGIPVLLPPLAFLLGWFLPALSLTARHDPWWVAVGAATLLLGALALPRPLLPAVLVALVMVHFLNRRLLAALDRHCREPLAPPPGLGKLCHHQLWLQPLPDNLRLGVADRTRLAWSVFVGLVFAFLALWEQRLTQAVDTSASLLALTAGIASLTRCAAYVLRLRPPLSLLGRLRHGRLILPGYDRALITPLLMLLALLPAASLGLFEDSAAGAAAIAVIGFIGFTAAAVTALFLCAGPGLSSWLLTAPCQMSPPSQTFAGNRPSPSRHGRAEIQNYC